MDNTEKVLRAFIEAQGYEIEAAKISAGELIDRRSSCEYTTVEIKEMYPGKHIECKTFGGDYTISEPVTDYKVTKIGPLQWIGDPIKDFGKMTLIDPYEAAKDSIRANINND